MCRSLRHFSPCYFHDLLSAWRLSKGLEKKGTRTAIGGRKVRCFTHRRRLLLCVVTHLVTSVVPLFARWVVTPAHPPSQTVTCTGVWRHSGTQCQSSSLQVCYALPRVAAFTKPEHGSFWQHKIQTVIDNSSPCDSQLNEAHEDR